MMLLAEGTARAKTKRTGCQGGRCGWEKGMWEKQQEMHQRGRPRSPSLDI